MKTVEQIIADHLDLDVEDVTDEKHLMEDLGADSLHTVELIMEFENEFGIEVPDGDADSLETVGEIKEYIDGLQ